jgi:hypothetical protein
MRDKTYALLVTLAIGLGLIAAMVLVAYGAAFFALWMVTP